MQLISHRGLDPLNKEFLYAESSREAFENLLERGFGLEFDINFSKDCIPFIFHDGGLSRISNGKDNRKFSNIEWVDIENYILSDEGHIISLEQLFELIENKQKVGVQSALHLKSKFQGKKFLDILVEIIGIHPKIMDKLFIFDVKIETTEYLKDKLSEIQLFFSVSHKYDKERFNNSVGGTLYTIEEVIKNRNLINGVWLDEWDRNDRNGRKKLYTVETINQFKSLGLKTVVISPELHAKSPGLLGGEFHDDVENDKNLRQRIKEIKFLDPDFICTDYLDYYK